MSNSSEIGKELIHHNCASHSEDEEESLSLCDLPLASTAIDQEGEREDGKQRGIGAGDQSEAKLAKTSTESENGVSKDFDFGSLAASLDALEAEMCAADEVFFRGQILPFRHSVSYASTAATASNLRGTISRSESMDRNTGSGFQSSSTASSSRSSSTRSSSINSSASAGKLPPPPPQGHSINSSGHKRQSKIRNQFHSFPSPKPYARASNAPRSATTASANKRSSALWEIFRLGLVRTPEIELEDLKIRCGKQQNLGGGRSEVAISRNSSSGGSENGKSVNIRSCKGGLRSVRNKRKSVGAMNFMSCKCSAEAVEPEKGGKPMAVGNKEETETMTEEKQRKHDVSRHHRTFEWLKELSHAVVLNDVSTN